MIFISHRGNLNGKNEFLENSPKYIDLALSKNFDVEIDIWKVGEDFYLGHDKPEYIIDLEWLLIRCKKIWIHCKNIDSFITFKDINNNKLNFFWHENDTLTLTSLGYIWVFPGKQPIKNSISVLPELYDDETKNCLGICSDYIEEYKFNYAENRFNNGN